MGCGGVASAIAWPLSLIPLRGAPLAGDDDTNPNQHLNASLRDVGGKAELLAALLRSGVSGRDVARVACDHLRPLPNEPAVCAPVLSAAQSVRLAAEIVKHWIGTDVPLAPATNMLATSILTAHTSLADASA